jgi:2-dehydro-3-deoxygluconokinase
MGRIVTLGEIMLRLSPPDHQRFVGSTSYDAHFGGSEANVAAALSQWGKQVSFVTKVPHDAIGDSAISSLRTLGIDTTYIVRGEGRLGIYYLENGYSIRPSMVIYDRAGSAISRAAVDEFQIKEVLEDAELFHVSGITLGIGDHAFALAKSFITAAKQKGIPVSFDFNYRSKLWTLAEAKEKITTILHQTDIVLAGHLDITNLLGIEADFALQEDHYFPYLEHLYRKLHVLYPNVQIFAASRREVESSSRNQYQGIVFNGDSIVTSKIYAVDIIDRVGTGDAFAAGILYAFAEKRDSRYMVDFAAAAAALKHTMPGDTLITNVQEIEETFLAAGCKIQR